MIKSGVKELNPSYKDIDLAVIKSKKSGRLLKFRKLCDDGYGVYEDLVDWEYIQDSGNLPSVFPPYSYVWNEELGHRDRVLITSIIDIKSMLIYDVIGHDNDDLEVIIIVITAILNS